MPAAPPCPGCGHGLVVDGLDVGDLGDLGISEPCRTPWMRAPARRSLRMRGQRGWVCPSHVELATQGGVIGRPCGWASKRRPCFVELVRPPLGKLSCLVVGLVGRVVPDRPLGERALDLFVAAIGCYAQNVVVGSRRGPLNSTRSRPAAGRCLGTSVATGSGARVLPAPAGEQHQPAPGQQHQGDLDHRHGVVAGGGERPRA